jgi:hypothetical protein
MFYQKYELNETSGMSTMKFIHSFIYAITVITSIWSNLVFANEPPVWNNTGNEPILLSEAQGPYIGVEASDENGDNVVVSIVGPDADLFTYSFDGIRFITSPDYETPLDSETNNIYHIIAIATDASTSRQVALTIEVLNDGPEVLDTRFSAAIELTDSVDIPNYSYSTRFFDSADLNGNGNSDLIVYAWADDSIYWYPNNGDGTIGESETLTTTSNGNSLVRTLDFDGDDDIDVIAASANSSASFNTNTIEWYRNSGNGEFSEQLTIASGIDDLSVFTLGDFDQDGDVDIVLANRSSNTILWIERLGENTFANPDTIINYNDPVTSIESADIDGDGDLDILGLALDEESFSTNHNVFLVQNLGEGNFSKVETIDSFQSNVTTLAISDLDLDGDLDLASYIGEYNKSKIVWYQNLGNNKFDSAIDVYTSNTGNYRQTSLIATDIDDDGYPDLVSNISAESNVLWLKNYGNGTFTSSKLIDSDISLHTSLAVLDLTSSGRKDILLSKREEGSLVFYENTLQAVEQIELSALEGSSVEFNLPLLNNENLMYVLSGQDADLFDIADNKLLSKQNLDFENPADANHDNKYLIQLDISNETENSVLDVTLVVIDDVFEDTDQDGLNQREEGVYGTLLDNADSDFDGVPDGIEVSDGSDPLDIFSFADANENGLADYLDANPDVNTAPVFLKVGLSQEMLIDNELADVNFSVAADIDGDNDIDLVAASSSSDNDIIVWYENIGGTFSNRIVIDNSLGRPTDIVATDIDKDGDTDLVAAVADDQSIVLYINNGSGQFSDAQQIATDEQRPYLVIAADLNGDSELDIVFNTENSTAMYWVENKGSSNFGESILIDYTGEYGPQFDIEDIDSDGDNDITTLLDNDRQLVWYANDGAGIFERQAAPITTGFDFEAFHQADLDADGDIDVISARSNYRVNWHENDGTGNFSTHEIGISESYASTFVSAKDLDADGDLDIISNFNNTIYWHENGGRGAFSSRRVLTSSSDPLTGLTVADFNKDSLLDIVTHVRSNESVIQYSAVFKPNFELQLVKKESQLLTIPLTTFDANGDDITITLAGTDAELFSVLDNDVVSIASLDFESPTDSDQDNIYEFVAQINDGNASTEMAITITIIDDELEDYDKDGLNQRQEQLYSSSDSSIDSDGDGVPDGQEVADGTRPSDTNSFLDVNENGIPDFAEGDVSIDIPPVTVANTLIALNEDALFFQDASGFNLADVTGNGINELIVKDGTDLLAYTISEDSSFTYLNNSYIGFGSLDNFTFIDMNNDGFNDVIYSSFNREVSQSSDFGIAYGRNDQYDVYLRYGDGTGDFGSSELIYRGLGRIKQIVPFKATDSNFPYLFVVKNRFNIYADKSNTVVSTETEIITIEKSEFSVSSSVFKTLSESSFDDYWSIVGLVAFDNPTDDPKRLIYQQCSVMYFSSCTSSSYKQITYNNGSFSEVSLPQSDLPTDYSSSINVEGLTYTLSIDIDSDGDIDQLVLENNVLTVLLNVNSLVVAIEEVLVEGQALNYVITALDPDNTGEITYELLGNDADIFSLNNNILTLVSPLDFENPTDNNNDNIYEVIISLSDGTSTSETAFSVEITDTFSDDTDGDGLTQGQEVSLGLDDKNPDFDNDLVPDGQEVADGTSPSDPLDFIDLDENGIADFSQDSLGNIRPSLNAQTVPSWLQRTIDTNLTEVPSAIALADINADNNQDIIAFVTNEQTLYLMLNDGAGNYFEATPIASNVEGDDSIVVADLDDDGQLDIVAGSRNYDTLHWYKNNGNLQFSTKKLISEDLDRIESVITTDIDGDGDADVVTASYNDDTIAWFENDGNGNFSQVQIISSSADGAYSVNANDLDGDSNIDIVAAAYNEDAVFWFKNDGAGNFSEKRMIDNDVDGASTVDTIDPDGDGIFDVLSGSRLADSIFYYVNDGDGIFSFRKTISSSIDSVRALKTADVDGDGRKDIITAADGALNRLAWFRNIEDNTFSKALPISNSFAGAYDLFALGENTDGISDIIALSFNDTAFTWFKSINATLESIEIIVAENSDDPIPLPVIDADDDPMSVTISGQDSERFNVNGTNLTFVTTPNFESPADSNGDNVYAVQASVSDGTDERVFNVFVKITNIVDSGEDIDNDGLTEAQEDVLGTNYLAADTDEDGISDGDEVNDGSDPLDSASFTDTNTNGIPDALEESLSGDSDGDSVSDYVEAFPGENDTPTISGDAPNTYVFGQSYLFTPNAFDADGDDLLFTITNKPNWLDFNVLTGELSANNSEPDSSSYTDIVITVSDEFEAQSSLAPITVFINDSNGDAVADGYELDNIIEDAKWVDLQTRNRTGDAAYKSGLTGQNRSFTSADDKDWLVFDIEPGAESPIDGRSPNSRDLLIYWKGIGDALETDCVEAGELNQAGFNESYFCDTSWKIETTNADITLYKIVNGELEPQPVYPTGTKNQFEEDLPAEFSFEMLDVNTLNGFLDCELTQIGDNAFQCDEIPTIDDVFYHFSVRDLSPGRYYLEIDPSDHFDNNINNHYQIELFDFPTLPGVLAGQVKDERGNLLQGVDIYFNGVKHGTPTLSKGGFFKSLDLGTYQLVFVKSGYKTVTETIVVTTADEGKQLDDLFVTMAIEAPPEVNDSDVSAITEDTPVSGNLLDNVTSDDDNLLVTEIRISGTTYEVPIPQPPRVVALDGIGQFTISSNGDYQFSPLANYVGEIPTLFYTVDNGQGTATASVSFSNITAVNDNPTINGVPSVTAIENSEYLFTPTANDVDSEVAGFTIENKPQWLVFNPQTGALSGTPEDKDVREFKNILITVTDTEGAAATLAGFDINVQNINDEPTLSGIPTVTLVDSAMYSFTPSASDDDLLIPESTETLTFSIENLPSWAQFNASTGELSGTPTFADVDTYTDIVISVEDSLLATASLPTFSIVVSENSNIDRIAPRLTVPEFDGLPLDATSKDGLPKSNNELAEFITSVTAFDQFDDEAKTVTNNLPDILAIGNTEVTFEATDSSGNTGSETIVISVADISAPTLLLLGEQSLTLAYQAEFTDPGYEATDAVDGDLTEVVEIEGEVDTSILGEYTLTYKVSDDAENRTSVTRTVIVQDAELPIITLADDIVVAAIDADGVPKTEQSIVTFLSAAKATDKVDGELTVSNNAPDVFPLGDTVVVFTASDNSNNMAEKSAIISVTDQDAPTLTLTNPGSITISQGDDFEDPGFEAIDNVDRDITDQVVVTGTVDEQTLGIYELTYSVSDAADNKTTLSRNVIVADQDAPIVEAPGNIVVAAIDANGTPISNDNISDFLASAVATDTNDGALQVTNNAPNVFPLGTTTVQFAAIDDNDNQGIAVANVTVEDQTSPVITLEGETSIDSIFGIEFVEPGVTAIDNVDGVVTSNVAVSGSVDTNMPGDYTLSYNVEDAAGNSATEVQRTVTIVYGDNIDTDDDGYSDLDEFQNQTDVNDPTSIPEDNDMDFISNLNDDDDDNDGTEDSSDAFPFDPNEIADSDLDGVGDNADAYPNDPDQSIDITAPVFSEITNVQAEATANFTSLELLQPQASDDAGGSISVTVDNSGPFPVGTTEVTWTVSDNAGNTAIAQQTINIVDTTVPEFEILTDLTIDATGRFTDITDITLANAIDLVDGEVSVTAANATNLPSGSSNVELQAIDAAGNLGSTMVQVLINPIINVQSALLAAPNEVVNVPISLMGAGAVYPVEVEYQITTPSETLTGSASISQGLQSTINFDTPASATNGEQWMLTLTNAENAVLGNTQSLIVINTENFAPSVTPYAEQNGTTTRIVEPNAGAILLKANVKDVNPEDTHSINFFSDTLGELGSGEQVSLDETDLPIGTHLISVIVTENNTAEAYESVGIIQIIKLEQLPELSAENDSDGDGIDDQSEGFADTDGDGIADFLDSSSDTNTLPVAGTDQVIEVEAGLSLSIGTASQTANQGQGTNASLSNDQLAEQVNNSDLGRFTPIGQLIDFKVSGLPFAGDSIQIVVPLTVPIPIDAVYIKYLPSAGWIEFVDTGSNLIASASLDNSGNCPSVSSTLYNSGLTVGDHCVLLTLEDGGPYDFDEAINGIIEDPGTLALAAANMAPRLDTQATLNVDELTLVDLDASATTDNEGDNLTFIWTQTSGTDVEISNGNSAIAGFTTPDIQSDTQLQFTISVFDGINTVTETVTVNVAFVNQEPQLAWVTTQRRFNEGTAVSLQIGATDDDGQALSYNWTQTSGIDLGIVSTNQDTISFTAPNVSSDSQVVLTVIVSDGESSVSQEVTLTIANTSTPQVSTSDGGGGGSIYIIIGLLALVTLKRYSTQTKSWQ